MIRGQPILPPPRTSRRDNIAIIAMIVLASVVIYASGEVLHRNAEILLADPPPEETTALPPTTETQTPATKTEEPPTSPPTPSAPVKQENVTVIFDVVPENARILVDGKPMAWRVIVDPSPKKHRVVFRAPGFKSQRMKVAFDKDQIIEVKLKRRRPPRPVERPESDDSEQDILLEDLEL